MKKVTLLIPVYNEEAMRGELTEENEMTQEHVMSYATKF